MDILMPTYYKQFSCIGTACEDTCCNGWTVTVDKATYKKYKNVKAPNLRFLLEKKIKRNKKNPTDLNYAKLELDENQNCVFLTEEKLCSIHGQLGEKFLCNTCSVYPRSVNRFDSIIEVSLETSCPEALRLMILERDGINFELTNEFKISSYINRKVDSASNPLFWEFRSGIIRILQNRSQTIEIRLSVLGLLFKKAEEMKNNNMDELLQIISAYESNLSDDHFINSLNNLSSNKEFQIMLLKAIIEIRVNGGSSSSRYLDCVEQMIDGLGMNKGAEFEHVMSRYDENLLIYNDYMMKNEHILENFLVNFVFKNQAPYNQSTYFESYILLVLNFAMIKLHLVGLVGHFGYLNEEIVSKLIQSFSKEIDHNPSFKNVILKKMEENGYNTLAHMIVLLKD